MQNHNTKRSARRVHTSIFTWEMRHHKLSFNLAIGIISVFLLVGQVYAQKEFKVIASDGALSDQFGNAVDISGNLAVVGALQNDGNQVNSGAAYIFAFNETSNTWTEEAKLMASDGGLYDEFGTSVGIFGNTAVVGAPNHAGTGALYIFTKSETGWVQTDKIVSSDIAAGDYFGSNVAMTADRILVGAKGDNSIYGFDQGAAYVLKKDDSTLAYKEEAKLVPAASGSIFGFSSSMDLSDTHAIISCSYDRTNGNNNSSVYIFALKDGTWTEETRLVGSNSRFGDIYGSSVAIEGSLALVGAYLDDDAGQDAGLVFTYEYINDSLVPNWTETGQLAAGDASTRSFFGRSVAISGNQAIIGATGFDQTNEAGTTADVGATYIFTYDENGWAQTQQFIAEDAEAYDQLGTSVAIDGRNSIIGNIGDDDNGSGSGSAHILIQPDGLEIAILGDKVVYTGYDPTSCTTLTVDGAPEGSNFAWSTGENTSSIEVCLTASETISVVVVDGEGNSASAEINICVVNVRDERGRILMCIDDYFNPGEKITVSVQPFVVGYYLSRGATLGPCGIVPCGSEGEEEKVRRLAREVNEVVMTASPNPFVDQVNIKFQLPESTHATLEVFDLSGKRIVRLFEGTVEAGRVYEQNWKATHMIPGLYIYRLHTNTEVITRKMVLAR